MSKEFTFPITKLNYDAYGGVAKGSGLDFSQMRISALPVFGIEPKRLNVTSREVFSSGKTYLSSTGSGDYEIRRTPNSTYTSHDYFIEFEPTEKYQNSPTLQRLASSYIRSFDSQFKIIEAEYVPSTPGEFLKLYGKSPLSKPMRTLAMALPFLFGFVVAILSFLSGDPSGASLDLDAFSPYIIGLLIGMLALFVLPIFLNAAYQGQKYEKLSAGAKRTLIKQYKDYIYKKCKGAQAVPVLSAIAYLNKDDPFVKF